MQQSPFSNFDEFSHQGPVQESTAQPGKLVCVAEGIITAHCIFKCGEGPLTAVEVCTQGGSRRCLRPVVALACLASCTTPSLRACSASGRRVSGKPDQGGLIGDRLEIDPTRTKATPGHPLPAHEFPTSTPSVEGLAQDHLYWGRMPSTHQRQGYRLPR
jgi:hypothetical protein